MQNFAPMILLNISVGLLVAGLSWRLSRLHADGAHMRYWALYWAAATSSIVLGVLLSPSRGQPTAQSEIYQSLPIALLLALRPALMSMAAASLFKRRSHRAVWWIGAAAFLAALATIAAGRGNPAQGLPARPAAGVFLMSSAAAFVFAFAYHRRLEGQKILGLFSTCAILAYSVHLASFGMVSLGIVVYPNLDPSISTGGMISVVLGCFIAFGLGLDALRQAEHARHRAEALWDAAQDGMIVLNPNGIVLRANPSFCRLVGRLAGQVERRPFSESFVDTARPRLECALQRALRPLPQAAPHSIQASLANGRQVHLDLTISPLPDGQAFLSIVRDATERTATQQRFEMIVSRTPVGIHFYSFDENRGLVFTGSNPAADSILGFAHAELSGMTIEEAFPSLVGTEIPAAYLAVLKTGELFRREEVHYTDRRISGAFDVLCFRLTAGSIAVMFNNITERKRTEEALRASESSYRLITDNSTDMISVHAPDGTYLFASPSCRSILGYEPADLVGHSAYEFFHPDDLTAIRASHGTVTASGSPAGVTYRIRRNDGSWVWVETISRSIQETEEGGGANIVAVTRDVTERRQLEEQFHRSQRLDSIGRLAGGVAHDFNNLLTVINGFAGIISSDASARPKTRELASSILGAGSRAEALTQQLLAFSRRQRLEPVVLDLNQVILDAQHILRRLTREDIHFALDLCSESTVILADPTQLQQVLYNLAVNARDAIQGPGTVRIATRNQLVDGSRAAGPEVPPGRYTVLAFADTGSGMSASVREKIFEPFFTTKATGKGTGLGLSTVFGIVRQSNGYITVESEVGRGTEFKVFFPSDFEAGAPPGKV